MTTKNPERPLTLRQQRFVHEYLVDGNGTKAARRAGYAERSAYSIASRLLRKGTVTLALQTAEAERRAAAPTNPAIPAWLTPGFVIDQLRHVMELALNDGAYPAANKSLELLGRHLRMWSEDEGARVGGAQTVNIDQIVYHLDHGNGPGPAKAIETSVVDSHVVDSQGAESLRAELEPAEAPSEPIKDAPA